ncbi:HAD family hydrolase, partial [Vibrio cholerae]|nr:HAD family hydrolase [Vibrio cholerae]
MQAHIIWDWNGTLLDDFHISLKATNTALMGINVLPLSSEDYRSL